MAMFEKGYQPRPLSGTERYAWDKMTGKRPDLSESIGRQRTDYPEKPQSMMAMIRSKFNNQSMLGRRFHSGNMNMINRRRRAIPREMGGPPRLSHRNTQPNRGTFGIGQGINR